MSALDEWLADASAALGLPDIIDQDLVLDLSRDVAHAIVRPAAPLTAYLLGLAVARGADPAEAASTLTLLAQSHT
jgi:hypothetical protein